MFWDEMICDRIVIGLHFLIGRCPHGLPPKNAYALGSARGGGGRLGAAGKKNLKYDPHV